MHAFFAPLLALVFLVPGGGWLGVYLAMDREHAVVTEVVPGSPAQKAGLRAGDVIRAMGATKIASADDLIAAVGAASPGDQVRLDVLRNGKAEKVVVKLGSRPDENEVAESQPAPAKPSRGVRPGKPVAEVAVEAPAVAQSEGVYLGISITEGEEGVAIDRVLDGTPAAKAGLRAGDRLHSIGKQRVRSMADLDKAISGLRPGKRVAIQVTNGDERRAVVVTPGRRDEAGSTARRPDAAEVTETEEIAAEEVVREHAITETVEREHGESEREHGEREGRGHEGRESRERPVRAVRTARPTRERGIEGEIESLRSELKELKQQLAELRKQLRRGGK